MDKIVLLKTGWCDTYDGDEVHGNFGYIQDNGAASGHEKFNFRETLGQGYFGYCPPIGDSGVPRPTDRNGWTVVWVSKKPGTAGVRIVGVYEDASFEEKFLEREVDGQTITYCVRAARAYLVPSEMRKWAFPSPVRAGPCAYLKGAANDKKYTALVKEIEKAIGEIKTLSTSPVVTEAGLDPQFPDNEHIKAVEKASVDFVWKTYAARGYKIIDRQLQKKVGYDLEARKKKETLLLEVKGTAGAIEYGYITIGELRVETGGARDQWRLCMVTNALEKPKLRVLDAKEFDREFALEPIAFRFVQKKPKSMV